MGARRGTRLRLDILSQQQRASPNKSGWIRNELEVLSQRKERARRPTRLEASRKGMNLVLNRAR